METITIKIGGEDIAVPAIVNFATLERISPAIDAFNAAASGTQQTSAACAIMAGALVTSRPDLTVAEIKNRLRIRVDDGTDERGAIVDAVNALCVASGLVRKTGETQPPPDDAELATAA